MEGDERLPGAAGSKCDNKGEEVNEKNDGMVGLAYLFGGILGRLRALRGEGRGVGVEGVVGLA